MKLIVGLGNPGGEYESTRHNIGFMIVDRLSRELSSKTAVWQNDTLHKALVAKTGDVILVKPLTYMNNSGLAVKSLVDHYQVKPQDVWVVHDDIDLPLGKIRIRQRGGTAGHNGVMSILGAIKSDTFIRFRMGIGRGKESTGNGENKNMHHRSVIAFVLSRFNQSEAGSLKHLVKHGADAVQIALIEGLDRAMNRFN
ncbi:aminoacyl-tRNA hydrolase [Candidatus Gottesmanbacteria bacterium RBG_13_45_10]|uniref:Peptidyl-tRNA hydrolase n=1 Tax=Candidatus Gottesmanbacteria bacterium RBG_13_45_10 TaxID=1798370 RepID=A0A1F5ZI60_9BACT|nr:MAG: aminoacyl-tRNA hydrolase [Candidatus Gottesmanbacteria bacterium RBG_13_45_10]